MEAAKPHTEPNILKVFGQHLGTTLKHGRLDIPEKFGQGYCKGFIFNAHIRMLILHYSLKEELILTNPDVNAPGRMILFKFQHIFSESGTASAKEIKSIPSVLIATSKMNSDEVISIQKHAASVNIEIAANYLNGLFEASEKSAVLKSLLENVQPLLFEQALSPVLQETLDELIKGPANENFELFFLRIKAEELICRLLMELEKRDETYLYPLNHKDIGMIYKVRAQMLEHLENPPVIHELATTANMSPTKLKRLFKQIFGDSIFSYYQEFRMKEASRLLKAGKLSVSDVGNQLGFTNLSHFSKVFKSHLGMNPKKYTML